MDDQKRAEEKIAQCKSLRLPYLDLSHLNLQIIPRSISQLDWLGALSLSHNKIRNIDILKEHKKLKFIFMNENNISNIEVVKELPDLKKLEAHHNDIKEIKSLSSLSRLVYLDLAHNHIENINPITNIETLIWLSLKNNPINDNEAKKIGHTLKKLAHYAY